MEKRNSDKIIRVAVVGPESTGKSELSEKLAKHYQTVFVPEFARDYLNNLGRKYTYEDVLFIAEQQILLEKKMEREANKILFCDTALLSIKIWFQVVFTKVPAQIEGWMKSNVYDFYILTDIDMPWVDDPLREHPHFRKELLEMHREQLDTMHADFKRVNGLENTRFLNAVRAIENSGLLR
ncbi:MAG TPA: ATP-binding protein [Bacteroidia bacterium]